MKKPRRRNRPKIRIVQTKENKLRVAFNGLPDILKELTDRAARDDGYAWTYQEHLLYVLSTAVERMNELAKQRPDDWRACAEQRYDWPMMVGLHPHDIKGMEKGAAVRDFLETLGLGKRAPFRLAPGTQLDNPATRMAIKLCNEVSEARRDPLRFVRHTGWRGKAQRLGEPVKANAPQWWTVAEMILKERFPSPTLGNDKELCGLVKRWYKDGDLHHKILSKIKRAFLSLFA